MVCIRVVESSKQVQPTEEIDGKLFFFANSGEGH